MTTPRPLAGALHGGRAAVVVGGVAAAVAVWAAAVPRPAQVILRADPDATVDVQGYDDTALAPRSEIDAPAFVGSRSAGSLLDTVLGWATVAVLTAAVLLLVVVLARALLRAYRDRRVVTPDASGAPDLERVAAAVATDAEGRLLALAGGTPAEGIVAAWERLESVLRDAGLALPASRTSSETTVDALARFVVDGSALRDLAALYREARWSRHPMTEDDRRRAEAALRVLDARLAGAGAPGGSRG